MDTAKKLVRIYPYNVFARVMQIDDDRLELMYHLYPPALIKAIESLDEKKRDVIKMRFDENMTLEQVGNSYGVTRERVRQIEALAIHELRHPEVMKTYKYALIPETAVQTFEKVYSDSIEILNSVHSQLIDFKCDVVNADDDEYTAVLKEAYNIAEEPLEVLDLSVRSWNVLRRAGVTTVRELTYLTSKEITEMRNAGMRTLTEITTKLHSKGLKLADEVGEE